MIKYEKIVEDLLTEIFRESWMTPEDYLDIIDQLCFQLGMKNKDELVKFLSNNIQLGEKQGISIDEQIQLIKKMLSA